MSTVPFDDPHVINKLGNITATSTAEVVVYARTYVEPGAMAQRSVVSTSVNDTAAGSGAKIIRITYLDSTYISATEDVTMNGTTPVNTASSTIRFIEKMEVISGTFAAGAVSLMSTTGGGGSEVIAIPSGNTSTLICHHYVAAGKTCYIVDWSASTDHDVKLKLLGQDRVDGVNLVDRHLDLLALQGIQPTQAPGLLEFRHEFVSQSVPEKSYVRVTVVPNTATSTLVRARMTLWEA